MVNLQRHYNEFNGERKAAWVWSQEYYDFWAKEISELMEREFCGTILDIGCGNGAITERLAAISQNSNVVGIDPFLPSKMKNIENLVFLKTEALPFLEKRSEKISAILFKQVIHHFEPGELRDLLKQCREKLEKTGVLIVLTMPETIEYPMVKSVRDEFEKNQVNYDFLEHTLRELEFSVERKRITYEKEVSYGYLVECIKERFISDISRVPTEVLMQELSDTFPDDERNKIFTLKDTLNCFLASQR